jgi:AmiR/NasT family two-component response regulator
MSAVDGKHDVERLRALSRMLAERNGQLEHALQSRVVIEQAKGMLMERYGLDPPAAFELLRNAARSHRLRIAALAERVVSVRETPPEIRQELLVRRVPGRARRRRPGSR